MKITKDKAIECLETLYNLEGNSQSAKIMYDNLKRFIEQSEIIDIKKTKEYKNLERQWFLENQLCDIYKNRLRKAATILSGKYD